MKTGFENKKQIIWLAALGLVLLYVFYTNVISPSDEQPRQQPVARATRSELPPPNISRPDPALVPAQPSPRARARRDARAGVEFKMRVGDGVDPASIDPTLRLDLLAKVQAVTLQGGERNLFQFGAAPMPKTPEPKVIPKSPAALAAAAESVAPAEPVKPPPPPIPLTFYGYSQARPGVKRAFFLDGDDIIVADEGSLVKKRYKVLRIGINSVVVEDTEQKREQTLALKEPAG